MAITIRSAEEHDVPAFVIASSELVVLPIADITTTMASPLYWLSIAAALRIDAASLIEAPPNFKIFIVDEVNANTPKLMFDSPFFYDATSKQAGDLFPGKLTGYPLQI